MIYEHLLGGYLAPAYEILPSEAWTTDVNSSGTAQVTTTPKYQGTHSLGVTSPGTGMTVVTSAMAYDLSAYEGVALPTYATEGSPLMTLGTRLITDPTDVNAVDVTDVTSTTHGGHDCLVLHVSGITPVELNVVSGVSEVVLTGTNLDGTFIAQDAVADSSPADSLLYVRSGLTPSGPYDGTAYVYGADARYFSVTTPAGGGASALSSYETGGYDTTTYGSTTPITLDAWTVTTVPIPSEALLAEEMIAVNSPTWGAIVAVHIALYFADAGTVYLDGIGGWVRASSDEASANQYVSSLPTYHHDQNFTDVFAQAIGFELDTLRGTVGVGLEERLVARATYDLNLHEEALGVAPYPLLRSIAQRRGELMGYLSMPASLTESEAALGTVMGTSVTLSVDQDALTVDVSCATTDATEQARLRRACTRLLPAHLGVQFHFTGEGVRVGARESSTFSMSESIT